MAAADSVQVQSHTAADPTSHIQLNSTPIVSDPAIDSPHPFPLYKWSAPQLAELPAATPGPAGAVSRRY